VSGEKPLRCGVTFSKQAELPKLPVPDLDDTVEKLLEWTEPLVDGKTFIQTRASAEAFTASGGDGRRLQEALLRFADAPGVDNWMEPFWLEHYLGPRQPAPINVNIFYLFDRNSRTADQGQAERAADIIVSTLKFKDQLDRECLAPDSNRDGPLCMDQFHRMFSSTRIPRKEMDFVRSNVSEEFPTSPHERHIVILCKGRVYRLDVIDANGALRHRETVLEDVRTILRDTPEHLPDEECISLFTTMNRDEWAESRYRFTTLDPANAGILDTIERALFVISLDSNPAKSVDELSAAMLHGDGRNHWFDKPLLIIVTLEGEAAINMEHSSTDGSAIVSLSGFIFDDGGDEGDCRWTRECEPAEPLAPVLDSDLRATLKRAARAFDDLRGDVVTRVILFQDFGKERIKKGGVSPDGFIQMGIQLAQYRLFGEVRSTYEAVMTRRFLHGRTEALRSVSAESCEFVHKMEAPSVPAEEKVAALKRAIEKQVSRLGECKNGLGVERHMLGLRAMYKRYGADLGITEEPALFSDPGFRTLTTSLVSTSTSGHNGLKLAGFGPVAGDGLGIRYLTFSDAVHFNTTSRSHVGEKLEKFGKLLREALTEMIEMLEG